VIANLIYLIFFHEIKEKAMPWKLDFAYRRVTFNVPFNACSNWPFIVDKANEFEGKDDERFHPNLI
jgi:hypothetical protein